MGCLERGNLFLILTWLNSPMLCIGNLGSGFYPGVNTFYLTGFAFFLFSSLGHPGRFFTGFCFGFCFGFCLGFFPPAPAPQ